MDVLWKKLNKRYRYGYGIRIENKVLAYHSNVSWSNSDTTQVWRRLERYNFGRCTGDYYTFVKRKFLLLMLTRENDIHPSDRRIKKAIGDRTGLFFSLFAFFFFFFQRYINSGRTRAVSYHSPPFSLSMSTVRISHHGKNCQDIAPLFTRILTMLHSSPFI